MEAKSIYQFSLPYEITLEGIGFEWIIKFERVTPEGFTDGQMTLKMRPVGQERYLGCVQFSSSYNDLVALADHFDSHIKRLIQDPWSDSDVFVQYGLEFQVQALCGEVGPDMEGDFTLRVMLGVDKATDGSTIYVGIEAVIDVAKCHAFVTKLRHFLKAWSSQQGVLQTVQSHKATHIKA